VNVLTCDIAIIGGGMGGCAAAIAVCNAGRRVILTEPTDWIGGQMTAQGVSALDEHPLIEHMGGTKRYRQLREGIRAYYQERYGVPAIHDTVNGANLPLNPGNGWVSLLCFEPRVGLKVLDQMLAPSIELGLLSLLLEHCPIDTEMDGNRVVAVMVQNDVGEITRIEADIFLDATEPGDLLPLTHTPYVTGAESRADTGEPHATEAAKPGEIQGFTFSFAVEYRPGESHMIAKPDGYEYFRDHQPYTLSPIGHDGEPQIFRMFTASEQGKPPFWTYRRIFDGGLLGGNDIALINWISNDYHGASIIDMSEAEAARAIDEAKRLSLGFLYWLQTECPRDEGGYGYPELMLRSDIMGTADGLSKAPYIRESRRIIPLRRVLEQDIAAEVHEAKNPVREFADSVGIGWYHMDLHPSMGNPHFTLYAPTRPYQIPLGALIPQQTINLIAGCKNIGTTHLTNGAYRLHPTEWSIGEAAGMLAVYCLENGCQPREVWEDSERVNQLQEQLRSYGIKTEWEIG
jgi:hypothetical protein